MWVFKRDLEDQTEFAALISSGRSFHSLCVIIQTLE